MPIYASPIITEYQNRHERYNHYAETMTDPRFHQWLVSEQEVSTAAKAGVGMDLSDRHPFTVQRIRPDGPAARMGVIKVQDELQKVNGVLLTADLTGEQVRGLVIGEVGSVVELLFKEMPPRTGPGAYYVRLKRQAAKLSGETSDVGGRIAGYIKLFDESSTKLYELEKGISSIIESFEQRTTNPRYQRVYNMIHNPIPSHNNPSKPPPEQHHHKQMQQQQSQQHHHRQMPQQQYAPPDWNQYTINPQNGQKLYLHPSGKLRE